MLYLLPLVFTPWCTGHLQSLYCPTYTVGLVEFIGLTIIYKLWSTGTTTLQTAEREEPATSGHDIFGSEADVSSVTGIVVVLSIHTGSCFAGGDCCRQWASFRGS